MDYDTGQELAFSPSCPTEQGQGIPLNEVPLSLLQEPLKNTKIQIFFKGWKRFFLEASQVYTLNFKLFVLIFLMLADFFFFPLLLKPQSSTLLPCGKDFFIKTCIIIPLSPLLPISSQASALPLKIKTCTRVQKLDGEPNVDHALKEAKNSPQTDFTLWVCDKEAVWY